MQKLMGDEGWGGGLVFLYWPQVSVVIIFLPIIRVWLPTAYILVEK